MQPNMGREHAAVIFHALEMFGGVNVHRFFDNLGRPVDRRWPPMVEVPAGSFVHQGRSTHLGVSFLICAQPVSVAEFRQMYPGALEHLAPSEPAPLSWFEANLYVAWRDGVLPTQAERHYTRDTIGTPHGPEWCGDGATPLEELSQQDPFSPLDHRRIAWEGRATVTAPCRPCPFRFCTVGATRLLEARTATGRALTLYAQAEG